MARIITIPTREDERISAFQARHNVPHEGAPLGSGIGRYTLEITQTTLGTKFVILCMCGAREDVTAYDEW